MQLCTPIRVHVARRMLLMIHNRKPFIRNLQLFLYLFLSFHTPLASGGVMINRRGVSRLLLLSFRVSEYP